MNSGHVLQASLGYFIEPVVVALIGVIAFREKPTVAETITFLCAVGGIVFLTLRTGTFPTLALLVAVPFAVYGGLKKRVTLTAQTSLFVETLWVTPVALLFSGGGRPRWGARRRLWGARPSGSSPPAGW